MSRCVGRVSSDDLPLADIALVGERDGAGSAPELQAAGAHGDRCARPGGAAWSGRIALASRQGVARAPGAESLRHAAEEPSRPGELEGVAHSSGHLRRAERALLRWLRHGNDDRPPETEFDPVIGLTGVRELARTSNSVINGRRRHPGGSVSQRRHPQHTPHGSPVCAVAWSSGAARRRWRAATTDISAEAHRRCASRSPALSGSRLSFHQDFRDNVDGAVDRLPGAKETIAERLAGASRSSAMRPAGRAAARYRLNAVAVALRDAGISVDTLRAADRPAPRRDGGSVGTCGGRLRRSSCLLAARSQRLGHPTNIRNAFTPLRQRQIRSRRRSAAGGRPSRRCRHPTRG